MEEAAEMPTAYSRSSEVRSQDNREALPSVRTPRTLQSTIMTQKELDLGGTGPSDSPVPKVRAHVKLKSGPTTAMSRHRVKLCLLVCAGVIYEFTQNV